MQIIRYVIVSLKGDGYFFYIDPSHYGFDFSSCRFYVSKEHASLSILHHHLNNCVVCPVFLDLSKGVDHV